MQQFLILILNFSSFLNITAILIFTHHLTTDFNYSFRPDIQNGMDGDKKSEENWTANHRL